MMAQLSGAVRAILIMSLSGGVLTLALYLLRPLLRHRLPKSAQYGLWLVILAALLIPLSKLIVIPEAPSSVLLAPIDTVIERSISNAEGNGGLLSMNSNPTAQSEASYTPIAQQSQNPTWTIAALFLMIYPWVGAMLLLYNAFSYARFTRKIRRHRTPARTEELHTLAELCESKTPPRLYSSPLAATPMLIGLFRPEIVLPDRELTDAQLRSILSHELTHLRRFDVAVKWLSVFACAVHWFNPFVWLARREIDRACELSCDEAVIRALDQEGKQQYGDTLLSVAVDSRTPRAVLSTTMCEKKKTLKERLDAIMKHQARTRKALFSSIAMILLTVITVGILGAGMIPVLAEEAPTFKRMPSISKQVRVMKDLPVDIDPTYLKQLRDEGVRVSKPEEFWGKYQQAQVIIVEESMTLDEDINYNWVNVLLIEEGVTLTITSMNFFVYNEIVNLGEIIVTDEGRMRFIKMPNDSYIGKVSVIGRGEIEMYTNNLDLEFIASVLDEKSVFTTVQTGIMNNAEPPLEDMVIDRDFLIPFGKKLSVGGTVLRIQPGVTLTNNGRLITSVRPIIEGTVEGNMPLRTSGW